MSRGRAPWVPSASDRALAAETYRTTGSSSKVALALGVSWPTLTRALGVEIAAMRAARPRTANRRPRLPRRITERQAVHARRMLAAGKHLDVVASWVQLTAPILRYELDALGPAWPLLTEAEVERAAFRFRIEYATWERIRRDMAPHVTRLDFSRCVRSRAGERAMRAPEGPTCWLRSEEAYTSQQLRRDRAWEAMKRTVLYSGRRGANGLAAFAAFTDRQVREPSDPAVAEAARDRAAVGLAALLAVADSELDP